MSHTPGPWQVSDGTIANGNAGWVSVCLPDEEGTIIADMLGWKSDDEGGGERPVEECRANAALMAAAPELLTACKSVRVAIRLTLGKELAPYRQAWEPLVEAIESAIALAEGVPTHA